jgi:hypothetical protein
MEIVAATQEVAKVVPRADGEGLRVGQVVEVVPNHSCLAAACFPVAMGVVNLTRLVLLCTGPSPDHRREVDSLQVLVTHYKFALEYNIRL